MVEPVKFQRASAAAPKLTPPQKAAVERNLDADERALLKAEKSAAFRLGAMLIFPAMLLGIVIGFITYDTAVMRTLSSAQDMAIKTQIARDVIGR